MNTHEAYKQPYRTLDLYGVNEEQWQSGSIMAGGSSAEVVRVEDAHDWNSDDWHQVENVVFGWGDPRAEEIFQTLLEHKEDDEDDLVIPFSASVILGDKIWSLAIQHKNYDPELEVSNDEAVILPQRPTEASKKVQELFETEQFPLPRLLSKVGTRYVLLEMGVDFPLTYDGEPERSIYFRRKKEVLRRLQHSVEARDFSEHEDADNFHFAHGAAAEIAREFEYQASLPLGSVEFNAQELPESIRTLAAATYSGETVYSRDTQVRTYFRGEDEIIPPKWPSVEQFLKKENLLQEVQDALSQNPDLLSDYQPSVRLPDETVIVQIQDTIGPHNRWGLRFHVSSEGIDLAVYGDRGATESATNFFLTYHDKPRVLCETVTKLALLSAEHEE